MTTRKRGIHELYDADPVQADDSIDWLQPNALIARGEFHRVVLRAVRGIAERVGLDMSRADGLKRQWR